MVEIVKCFDLANDKIGKAKEKFAYGENLLIMHPSEQLQAPKNKLNFP